MRFAAKVAIDKAAATGVAWVGARMSNHAGAAACYAMMPLARDMIGLYLAVANNNQLIAAGCARKITAAWVGNVSAGLGHAYRRADCNSDRDSHAYRHAN